MAKGQQRSNRELKKPKKEKPRDAPASPGSPWVTVDKMQTGGKAGGKRK